MLKQMSIRKIKIASLAIFVLSLFYLFPDNRREVTFNNRSIEYTNDSVKNTIYLIDSFDYVARTSIASDSDTTINKIKNLVEALIIGGKKSDIIPNGFRSIIPEGTIIKEVKVDKDIVTINFSKEFLEIKKENEIKMIESLIYTVTSVDGINKLIIEVEGNVLNKLPSGYVLKNILDRSFGINKKYEISSTNNINSYTVYYVSEYNDNKYYVPVTKYVNESITNPIKMVIESLTSSPIYETNLMSYLNASTKVNNYEYNDGKLKLNFNDNIYNYKESSDILEEVIYTIGLSLNDLYSDLKEVSFCIDDKEIYNLNIDSLN